ncbi:hypothetical protein [Streptosporangium subroseum]|uniref:hypothetical protein n=1 Tax=Streptosporangium subroseum TaxID=106412 RepID=UPI00308F6A37|nr:hypothetical protein OHB15_23845 [Streptosporangium subroseum]
MTSIERTAYPRFKRHPVARRLATMLRLSPFMRKHINVHGHYSFHLPDLHGDRRELCDPNALHNDESNP